MMGDASGEAEAWACAGELRDIVTICTQMLLKHVY